MCSPINLSEAYVSGFPKDFVVNMPQRRKLSSFQLEEDINSIIGEPAKFTANGRDTFVIETKNEQQSKKLSEATQITGKKVHR